VTLQGTVLHKSGLITGGQVPREERETFGEQDIQGTFFLLQGGGPDQDYLYSFAKASGRYAQPALRACQAKAKSA
jgi:hypothetical protein